MILNSRFTALGHHSRGPISWSEFRRLCGELGEATLPRIIVVTIAVTEPGSRPDKTSNIVVLNKMFATPICRAGGMPGFWKRSIDEFSRQAGIAIRMEGLHRPTKPRTIIKFSDPGSIGQCKVMSDKDIGGFSRASLTFVAGDLRQESGSQTKAAQQSSEVVVDEKDGIPSHALFKGTISAELPPTRPDIQRSGYAAWRTRDRGISLFGKLLWDLDPYNFLHLRIRSDGRKYFVNIQTESIVPTDIHQHLLPCFTPGEWETVSIPLDAFVRTNYGMVVEPQSEMMRGKVRSVGIGLIDRVPGPFELGIADVYAFNRPAARQSGKAETGFDLEPKTGMMDEVEPPRRKGEPERILI